MQYAKGCEHGQLKLLKNEREWSPAWLVAWHLGRLFINSGLASADRTFRASSFQSNPTAGLLVTYKTALSVILASAPTSLLPPYKVVGESHCSLVMYQRDMQASPSSWPRTASSTTQPSRPLPYFPASIRAGQPHGSNGLCQATGVDKARASSVSRNQL